MVITVRILLFLSVFFTTAALSAGVYQWRDVNGNVVYGDSPPESAAVQEVELPVLTVADSYPSADKSKAADDTAQNQASEQQATPAATHVNYEHFKIKSPQKDAAIRANNGNVLVSFDLKPALQKGHGIVVYLDGKRVASGQATVFSLEALDRGQHSLFAVLHNAEKEVIKNTSSIKFNVLRAAKR